MATKRKHWIDQLAHVELLTPKPDETVHFFSELLGMEESARSGNSVYFRGWGEWFHHSVKITASEQAGVGHIAWRTETEEDLEACAAFLESKGLGEGWIDGDLGHGRAYRFRSPDGHLCEIFHEVEYYQPPEDKKPILLNRPQRYVRRGVGVRRIDHINLFASNPTPCRELFMELGFKWHEGMWVKPQNLELGAWMAISNLSHDLAFLRDPTGARGRLNHLALWVDTQAEVLEAHELLREAGVFIEYGPGRHGISEAFFLYVYEPGGNRIEIFSGGYLNFTSDWGPILWDAANEAERNLATAVVGGPPPESLFNYGTPVVEIPKQA